MDIYRIVNIHLADEILHLMETKYVDYVPGPSVKFNRDVFDISLADKERPAYEETDIEIENIDTITAILREVDAGYKVLALNMANAYRPGGGFLSGAKAQEEDLFRCTNLSKALTDDLYPMHESEIIYSPKVHILRDSDYIDQENPITVGFCSIAAHRDPCVNAYGMLSNHVYTVTKCKIHMMFHIAQIQKYDCLILGALGCGAFNNPPYEIAKIFCEICSLYAQKFKKILFAVKSDHGNVNCEIFQQAFLETFKTETGDVIEMDLESNLDVLYDIANFFDEQSRTDSPDLC